MEIEAQMPTTSYNELQRVVVRHLEVLGLTHIQQKKSLGQTWSKCVMQTRWFCGVIENDQRFPVRVVFHSFMQPGFLIGRRTHPHH